MKTKLFDLAFGKYYPLTVLTVGVAYGTMVYFAHPYLVRMLCAAVGCSE